MAAAWLDARDDVATALIALPADALVRVRQGNATREVRTREPIPLGHKIALHDIARGRRVRKYGEFIGRLTADVTQGGWVHVHNLETAARRTTADEAAWRAQAAPPGGVHAIANAALPAGVTRSRDGRRRYTAHGVEGRVDVDVDGATHVFADAGGLPGEPGGVAVDADDHVWVALKDASAVLRFAPDGTLVRVVRLPVSRPTGIAFDPTGTHDLLVATTRDGLSAARLRDEPLAGSTLRFDAGVAGGVTTTRDELR